MRGRDSALKEWVRPYYLRYVYFPLRRTNQPRAFRACWRYPSGFLDEIALEPPARDGRDILFFPMVDWHGSFQRTQHLAASFAAGGHRCFVLNPNLGREYPTPYPWSPEPRVSCLGRRLYEIHVHLPREPVHHHRRLLPGEEDRIIGVFERLFRKTRPRDPLLIASFPVWAGIAEGLKAALGCTVVYDCHDYLQALPGVDQTLAEQERDLFDVCDGAVFSSDWLRTRWLRSRPELRSRSTVIRNAVALEDFPLVPQTATEGPPAVGYVGALASWFDIELVEPAVQAHPEWRFFLVGHVESRSVRSLARYPNVTLTGPVDYSELPAYLRQFRAAIIPFRLSPLTLAVNPVKLYEYLASGLPVVSTPLPEVRLLGDLVATASTPEQFLGELEAAMDERDPGAAAKRRRSVIHHTWRHRAGDLLDFARLPGAGNKPQLIEC